MVHSGSETMKPRNAGSTWPGPEYRIRVSFRAPIDFVFAWCTDYTPGDAALEKETYQRKIIKRTPRAVVFEDVDESKDGWDCTRLVVSLGHQSVGDLEGAGIIHAVLHVYIYSGF